MTPIEGRYHLSGDIWGMCYFHSYYDNFNEMLKEAYSKYESGYHVQWEDNVTGKLTILEKDTAGDRTCV